MKKLFLCVSISLIFVISTADIGGAMGERPDSKSEIKTNVDRINISDGVKKEEAVAIAKNYIIKKKLEEIYIISTAKVIENSHNEQDFWCVQFSTSDKVKLEQGLEWGLIYVGKRKGEIKEGGAGPS